MANRAAALAKELIMARALSTPKRVVEKYVSKNTVPSDPDVVCRPGPDTLNAYMSVALKPSILLMTASPGERSMGCPIGKARPPTNEIRPGVQGAPHGKYNYQLASVGVWSPQRE